MLIEAEHEALLRLLNSGAPASALRRLLETHGDAKTALAAGKRDWASHGLSASACSALHAPETRALTHALAWLQLPEHHLFGWRDAAYPPLLRRIASAPAMLFVAGDSTLLWRPTIAIVGSRAATAGGCANAAAFAEALARTGLCVASGLAAGIDAAAHRATLAIQGNTVAVLGTGPDIAYPVAHRQLMDQIEHAGALVSEHPPGTRPMRAHFPSRNRILAGLSLGAVVIEAAVQSGALITARQSADAGREVFALPGSIHNPMAKGCHRLIRDGAVLVETPEEVIEALTPMIIDLARSLQGELNAMPEAASRGMPKPMNPLVEEGQDHNKLWGALGYDPTSMDELEQRTGLTASELSSMLLTLELEGRVAAEHGRYHRVGC